MADSKPLGWEAQNVQSRTLTNRLAIGKCSPRTVISLIWEERQVRALIACPEPSENVSDDETRDP